METDSQPAAPLALAVAPCSAKYYTRDPECPYCGKVERDAWEIDFGGTEGETEITCGRCERDYSCSRSIEVSYTTRPLPNVLDQPTPGGAAANPK